MNLQAQILSMIRKAHSAGRIHPTSQRFYTALTGRGVGENDVDAVLSSMVRAGTIRVAAGHWYEVGVLEDTRKPRGPGRVDPKSAKARTLPLEFFRK